MKLHTPMKDLQRKGLRRANTIHEHWCIERGKELNEVRRKVV